VKRTLVFFSTGKSTCGGHYTERIFAIVKFWIILFIGKNGISSTYYHHEYSYKTL